MLRAMNDLLRLRILISWFLALLLLLPGCQSPSRTTVPQQAFHPEKLEEIDRAIDQAIADRKCPGGVLWLEHRGAAYRKSYGSRAVVPEREPMTEDTIFDAASLTKVMATTPAILLLAERNRLSLEDPVAKWIPEFGTGGKENVTIRHLLTHTSGLRPGIETRSGWQGQPAAIAKACAESLTAPPGVTLRYSDINYILLGEIVQRAGKMPLEKFVHQEIYKPLKMRDTGYLPAPALSPRIAPTEVVNSEPLRGVVHDPTARLMGGVAGHAGLFTTAQDLARYSRCLLNEGTLEGKRILKPETVRLMTSVQTSPALAMRRGLGWDIDTAYSGPRGELFPLGSYGHTGWTGGSMWLDPFSRTFVLFLSNRNHPDESGSVLPLRRKLGTLAAEAVRDFNFAFVPGALPPRATAAPAPVPVAGATQEVLNGIDVLARDRFVRLKNLRIGLITNHTGEDRQRVSTIDLLKKAPEVRLTALFAPEHGIRGQLDEKVSDTVDEKTGLPVHSLYGASRKPTAEQLRDLDALVFDIQDIGCRFYTYTATMAMALEAAAENGKKFFVLDRVNPIDGVTVDGPVLTGKPSFVGYHVVPLRYGMTMGELAKMFNEEKNLRADLTVIPVENWQRTNYFDATGLPWTNPSPNMRNLKQAILYPGVGLLESALSVGRGTDTPFEVVGAPYIDDVKFARELNRERLPGVNFVPIQFTPNASVHKGQRCGGVYLMLTDRTRCNVVDVGLLMAKTLVRMYPAAFDANKMSHLLLDAPTLEAVKEGKSLEEIRAAWARELAAFEKRRAKHLLY